VTVINPDLNIKMGGLTDAKGGPCDGEAIHAGHRGATQKDEVHPDRPPPGGQLTCQGSVGHDLC